MTSAEEHDAWVAVVQSSKDGRWHRPASPAQARTLAALHRRSYFTRYTTDSGDVLYGLEGFFPCVLVRDPWIPYAVVPS